MAQMKASRLKVKAIIFDLDGTLVDSREAYAEATKIAIAATTHTEISPRIITEIPRRLEQDMPIDDLIGGFNVEKFKKIYLKTYYQATREKSKPFPNVARTLTKLSSKTMLSLTTRRNVAETEVRKELAKFGLEQFFKKIVTSKDTTKPKPSPEALIKCAEYMQVPIFACAIVGDSVIDVKAGKNAGAKTVAVLTGIFSQKELQSQKPDLILRNINELPEFIE